MNIEELIRQLQHYPMTMRVIVDGYESGFDDISAIEEIIIKPVINPEWWNGAYESANKKDEGIEKAIVLHR